ncbi:MAG TPA: glycosyltransferase family 2 protein [Anaerolineaceae bacterium]|nr:glycosyltransferase family 2 protein [Anaerolineaceae bacterium]HPN51442.1 glycosyltransferase family 2 protein [Anaerolineaceae bacterium]
MTLISFVLPCYNEENNVGPLFERITRALEPFPYDFEFIFIDNASKDQTVARLKELATKDKRVKIIVNTRNFGQVRSPYHAFFQTKGDAVITMCTDLQDPPELLPDFIKNWEKGFKVVVGIKTNSQESSLIYGLRTLYYKTLSRLSDVEMIENFTGFGLYDREVVEVIRQINDPYPYFRGLIAELGYERAVIEYTQPLRKFGISKNNFYTLYDLAMLGITNHSKVPLRLAAILGFISAGISILVALFYFVYKLVFWYQFSVGLAPLVIGLFLFSSVQLLFLGLVGEYVGAIYTQIQHRPLVIEKERINFEN